MESKVLLRIHNSLGQEIATIVDKKQPAGVHEVKWDGSGVPSGVYFYRLNIGLFNETKKLVLLK